MTRRELLVLLLTQSACKRGPVQFKNGGEYAKAADAAADVPDEYAWTRPTPVRKGDRVRILVLYYARRSYEPRYAVWMDPDASIDDREKVDAEDVGIRERSRTVPGVERKKGVPLADLEDELYALCPTVWKAWADDRVDAEITAAASRYWAIYAQITDEAIAG